MIYAIKDKVPINGVVDNKKDKDGRPKDARPKDVRPKRKKNQLSEKIIPKYTTLATIDAASDNSGVAS